MAAHSPRSKRKWCPGCQRAHGLDRFWRDHSRCGSTLGYDTYCKEVRRAQARKRYREKQLRA